MESKEKTLAERIYDNIKKAERKNPNANRFFIGAQGKDKEWHTDDLERILKKAGFDRLIQPNRDNNEVGSNDIFDW